MIRLTNQNYCATIIKIKSTVKLDGLDNLVGAPLFGFTALIPKDYDLTKLYILFTAETQLSETYCHENNLFDKPDLNKDKSKKGYINSKRRVRAVKLKGNISSAFLMPIESLTYTGLDLSTLNEGDTFNYVDDEELCKKYIIRISRANNGQSKQKVVKTRQLFNTKLFPEHIDTSHWARNSDKVSNDTYIYVSQKLHGCLHYDTIIKTLEYGDQKLGYVVDNKIKCKVLCRDIQNGEDIYSDITNFFKSDEDIQWYEVETDNGNIITVTGDHPIWIPNLKCYRKVSELSVGDLILTCE